MLQYYHLQSRTLTYWRRNLIRILQLFYENYTYTIEKTGTLLIAFFMPFEDLHDKLSQNYK